MKNCEHFDPGAFRRLRFADKIACWVLALAFVAAVVLALLAGYQASYTAVRMVLS